MSTPTKLRIDSSLPAAEQVHGLVDSLGLSPADAGQLLRRAAERIDPGPRILLAQAIQPRDDDPRSPAAMRMARSRAYVAAGYRPVKTRAFVSDELIARLVSEHVFPASVMENDSSLLDVLTIALPESLSWSR